MIKCNTCAKSIPNDSEFCPFCGNKIIHIIEEQTETAEALLLYQPEALLNRVFLLLEEGLFDKADTYVESVLNREPENAKAHLAKLMIDLKVKTIEDLSSLDDTFEDNIHYKRVIRYGDDSLKESLFKIHNELAVYVEKQKEEERLRQEDCYSKTYENAKQLMEASETMDTIEAIKALTEAMELFAKTSEYEDSTVLHNECIYRIACIKISQGNERGDMGDFKKAIEHFQNIVDYKDSKQKIEECKKSIEDIHNENVNVIIFILASLGLIAFIVAIAVGFSL